MLKKYQRLISGTFISVMLIICALSVPFGKYISPDVISTDDMRLICYLIAYIIPGSTVFNKLIMEIKDKKYKAIGVYVTIITLIIFGMVNEIAAIVIMTLYAFMKVKMEKNNG